MGFLAGLYTLLLVAICLLQALLLYRTGKPAVRQDDEALKEWLRQQLEAQARVLEEKQAQQAQQNLAAMAHISDTLQTAVQGMSSTLTAGQNTQQQTMEQRLQGLEASNARKLEEITFDEMLELASLGAQVLNNRSVELAKKYNVELEVLSSLNPVPGTVVKEAVNCLLYTSPSPRDCS